MPRRSLPLALTIAVHVLLLACFYLARPAVPQLAGAGPQRSMLMLVLPKLLPVVKQEITKPVVRATARPQAPVARALPPRPAPDAPQAPVPVAVEPDAPLPDAFAAAPVAGDLAERARRAAGKIDRQLRAGKPVALSADARQARFERIMASAYIDKSNTLTVDRYESGDGVIIERLTRGGKSSCYMSGTINFVPGILRDSSKPKGVSCPPAEAGWTRK
ncbi:hypothetical protein CR105_02700 [Massilia eurypsychrophila]|uniref:Uncharacterized protein n=1 Tax=Massilia eurypsychrophila TaxID=1485217 RepID=A0A2G8TLY8_9BURK|nr:hypothetical protein [Massilia eurypsychrophila]PIL47065.1 hypothetical protein CR105_02700 [Massilia eurypsychrophila]